LPPYHPTLPCNWTEPPNHRSTASILTRWTCGVVPTFSERSYPSQLAHSKDFPLRPLLCCSLYVNLRSPTIGLPSYRGQGSRCFTAYEDHSHLVKSSSRIIMHNPAFLKRHYGSLPEVGYQSPQQMHTLIHVHLLLRNGVKYLTDGVDGSRCRSRSSRMKAALI
jgi:hypothetical protein